MALTNVIIQPGFNKQATEAGAEGQWIDGDFVRFRYGLPEKIGGWEQITSNTLLGAAREQLVWADLQGRIYAAVATHKCLFIYYSGAFYDITPLGTAIAGATFTTILSDATVTINKTSHGLIAGDILTFTSVTPPPGTGYTAADFTTNPFEVITSTTNTFTFNVPSVAAANSTASGAATINPYVNFGPLFQTYGYGFGTGLFGGTVNGAVTTTLDGALADDANGNNGSPDEITLDSVTGLATSGGFIAIGEELISYSGITSLNVTGTVRGVNGSTRSSHLDGATVFDATNYVGWGDATTVSTVVLDPASWSLDNYGQQLIATNKNGKTFKWDPIAEDVNALITRATVIANAPTASVMSIVSERDRHLFLLGTETSIGTPSTQDKMFIRFSDQENTGEYIATSTNTAGTFRLDSGTKIVGAAKAKDYILVCTDTAAYIMQFVGPPFTFSIRQVGSNCGLIGQHAIKYVNGAVYWMGQSGGFYVYDGTVKSLPSLVEDFVFETAGNDLGLNFTSGELVYAGVNTLYNEVSWFYPKSGSDQVDRVATYNFNENIWATGSLARTSYADATLFDNPYATEFDSTATPTFPIVQGITGANGATTYWAQEIGNNQVDSTGAATTINAYIQSGDFDLSTGGDGQFFMAVRRFIPDFKVLTGNAQISILLKRFPADTEVSSPLGPFSITSSTEKVDTRARARYASLKVENTAVNQTWRYGTFRADIQPDGMR